MPTTLEASVIIPAYRSQTTIVHCLETMFAQDFQDYEVIVIDSSPDDRTEGLARARFPQARYVHTQERLLPHAARNRGTTLARSHQLVFTDPDIYAPPWWLSSLVSAQRRLGGVVAGGLTCHGRAWVEMGMHLCKFDPWLPGGKERVIDISPTANMTCARAVLEAAGGFAEASMLADTLLSWRLAELGIPIWFAPQAAVEHHHVGKWSAMLEERLQRGREFALSRMREGSWSRGRIVGQLLVTLAPLRLAKLIGRGFRNAWRGHLALEYVRVSPVVVTGQAAWLAGEGMGYLMRLRGDAARS